MIKIAIDGPAGAGKSTIARELALELDITYIDTGAMYRALTLKAIRNNVDMRDASTLVKLAEETDIDLKGENVYLDGINVSADIRDPKVTKHVSDVAKIQGVREKMVDIQRKIAKHTSVVMDGRDIASHVMPNADLKIFLTASIQERARRRLQQLRDTGFESITLEEVQADIKNRDNIDSSREYAPLQQVNDAILIDSTNKTMKEIVAEIISYVKGA